VLLGAPADPHAWISIAAAEAAFESYELFTRLRDCDGDGLRAVAGGAGMLSARRFFYTGPVTEVKADGDDNHASVWTVPDLTTAVTTAHNGQADETARKPWRSALEDVRWGAMAFFLFNVLC